MAEVLTEAHLYSIGIKARDIDEFLSVRDQLLRHLANESGRKSAVSVANALSEARNSPRRLEECVCDAFRSLGFDVTSLGKSGQPDGVAEAHLSADAERRPRHYKVSLEAKSKAISDAKVSAKAVGIAGIVQHRDKFNCEHAIIVGPAFPTSKGDKSALGNQIQSYRSKSESKGTPRTITLITVDELAKLVRLRPIKQIGLQKIRELFTKCNLPEESAEWVESISKATAENPPYREIIETIEALQKEYRKEAVKYPALRIKLDHRDPPIKYETDDDLIELCKAMSHLTPNAIYASSESVELDQSAENVIAAIEAAIQDYPPDEQ